jgi:hypothetical protein
MIALSIFYTAAVTSPFVVTTAYWLYLFPISDFVSKAPLWPRFLQYFQIANSSIINSFIAFLEIMVLSSVRKQKVLSSQP